MAPSTSTLQDRFSFKAFGTGLLVVALLYALLTLYLLLNKENTLQSLEDNLASQTVLIDNRLSEKPSYEPAVSEQQTNSEIHTVTGLNPEDQVEAPAEPNIGTPPTVNDDNVVPIPDSAKALSHVPAPGLFEETSYGRLPVAKSPAETPFSVYKKPFILNRNQPYIAVVVKDFGLSRDLSMKMIKDLPSSVSFILSPYSSNPDGWVEKARADGHEVWLNMPVETNDFPLKDPGSKGLLTRVSLQYNQDRLGWLLGRTTGYTGVAIFTDSALDNAGAMFKNIARSIFRRGLGFLELNPADSYYNDLAREEGIARAQNSATIDFLKINSPALKQSMFRIDGNGGDIIVVAPTANNIDVLKSWINTLQNQGIQSAPVSAVAAMNSGL